VSQLDAILTDLKNGLDTANFLDLLTANSGCLPLIFPVSDEVQYGANDIMALIDNNCLTNISDKQREVFEWYFAHYLKVLEEGKHKGPAEAATQLCVQLPRLQDLIQYICGSPYLPSDGPIKISFTNSTLRDPESCFYNSKSASV